MRFTSKNDLWTEAEFQTQVLDAADELGWEYYHTGDSRRSQPGFPDLTLVKDGKVIFAELKREKKSFLRKDQMKWLLDLHAAAGPNLMAAMWRPSSNWFEVLSGEEWGNVHPFLDDSHPGRSGRKLGDL